MILAYSVLSAIALLSAAVFWSRSSHTDPRLLPLFAAALGGAILGAKLGFIAAEGLSLWRASGNLADLLAGKTIVGGLIGGYLGVELMKKALNYQRVTGDLFACVVPASIALGRVGCIAAGCCLGKVCPLSWYTILDVHAQARWPAAPVELLFNLICIGAFWSLRRRKLLCGQHFHLYMISYGLFRFLHEFMREVPTGAYGLSGYQYQAAILFIVGSFGFFARRSKAGNLICGY